ncbi:hypothetical protein C8F01DRAFT_476195 [Mycena amicta]|nr:hypothetical protein C8F01DRAFT_476195 [Mycena amicta]
MPPKKAKATKKAPAAKGKAAAKTSAKPTAAKKDVATGTKRAASAAALSEDEDSESGASSKKKARTEDPEETSAQNAPATAPANTFQGGKLDLYGMPLPFLRNALKPNNTGNLDYAALLTLIQSKQAKNDNSGRVVVSLASASAAGYGRFSSRVEGFCEPFEEEPYDIGIAAVKRVDKLSFNAAERQALWPTSEVPQFDGSPGLQGTMVLVDSPCGVGSVSGAFKMLTVPVKESDGVAMWVGVVSFQVKHGSLYQRKGFGRGTSAAFGFWAVAAKEGDQRALECADLGHLANRAGSTVVDDFDGGDGYGSGGDEDDEDDDEDDRYPFY